MSSRLLDLLAGIPGYVVAVIILVIAVKVSRPSTLDAIPTVGSSGWFGSWWFSLKSLTDTPEILQEGYEKSAPFKITVLCRWIVVVSSRKHVEELWRAPDDVLSSPEAINDQLHVEYTMGPEVRYNPYHTEIVRSQLTRNIQVLYPEIKQEICMALDDVLDLRGNEWKSIPAYSSMQKVICRTSNRVFVGLPLCRDPDWIDLNIQYTLDVVKCGTIVGLFPNLLKAMAARFLTNINQSNQRGRKLLGPMIEERQKHLDDYGNGWADKPNDVLAWLMDEAKGPESTVKSLTTRILVLNFAAIHTTSQSFTHVLFFLAANPQYIQPLRDEVEAIVEKEGWSKSAVGRMRKVDSFIKECQRLEGISSTGLTRKAMKDFTFSGGTFVPKGTIISAAIRSIHYDEAIYKNADAFEPFRFANLCEDDGEGVKHQLVSTTTEYLPFGHGRHACPGRFFAAIELKSMLAHIVMTYDIKLADNATRPPTLHFATAVIADPNTRVMFRRRVE